MQKAKILNAMDVYLLIRACAITKVENDIITKIEELLRASYCALIEPFWSIFDTELMLIL